MVRAPFHAFLLTALAAGCAQGGEESVATNEKPVDAAGWDVADSGTTNDASTDTSNGDAALDASIDVPHDSPVDVADEAPPADVVQEPPPVSACGVTGGLALSLADRQIVRDDGSDAYVDVPVGHVITGVGLRINEDRVRTLRVLSRALLSDGSLGPEQEHRSGDEPNGGIEAELVVPDCHVIVGAGTRSNDDNAKTLVVYAAPFSANGSLGPSQTFRGGSEPTAGVEDEYQAPGGRVLTGIGFRIFDDDVVGMRVVTDALIVSP